MEPYELTDIKVAKDRTRISFVLTYEDKKRHGFVAVDALGGLESVTDSDLLGKFKKHADLIAKKAYRSAIDRPKLDIIVIGKGDLSDIISSEKVCDVPRHHES
jgi:hypothetical protein